MRYILHLQGINELYGYAPMNFEYYIPSIIEAIFNTDQPISSDEVATALTYNTALSEMISAPHRYNGELATATVDESELYNAIVILSEALSFVRWHPVGACLIHKRIQHAQFIAPGSLSITF